MLGSKGRTDVHGTMKFLITNDDGIEAAGLNALLEVAQNFGEATIVAPAAPQSGVSHAVTWHKGVRIQPRGEKSQSGSNRHSGSSPVSFTMSIFPSCRLARPTPKLFGIHSIRNRGLLVSIGFTSTAAVGKTDKKFGASWPRIAR
jgi:hypothetical protein